MSVCATCQHFDKAAYPKNPHYGQCNYTLPPLPFWMATSILPKYRAVSIGDRNCATYSARDTQTEQKK